MYSNGIISAPISASDPYQVLGVGMYAGGYDIGYICSNNHGKINKWSYDKPIRVDTPAELSETQKQDASNGMDAYYSTDLDSVIANAEKADWGYLPPRSGVDWSRLTDFIGYNHNCVRPCTTKVMDVTEQKSTEGAGDPYMSANILFSESTQEAASIQGNIILTDMKVNGAYLSNCYFGVVILDANGNKIQGAISEYNFGDGYNKVVIRLYGKDFEKGEYQIIPIISSIKRDIARFVNGETWSGGWYCTVPTRKGKLTVLEYSDISFTMSANWNSGKTSITYNFYGTNRTNANYNIGKVKMRLGYYDYRDGQSDGAKVYVWDYYINSGEDVVLAANTENVDLRLGGSITESLIGTSFLNTPYFIELNFDSGWSVDQTYDISDN